MRPPPRSPSTTSPPSGTTSSPPTPRRKPPPPTSPSSPPPTPRPTALTSAPLARAFLDAALPIPGAPKLDYRAYAAHIRQEYAHVPDDAYRAGRSQVLRSFLTRPRLYQTHLLHEALDARSRLNLEWEI